MMLADFNTYLTDDILCKVDRASMFHSLETRAPYLDHNVSEFCFSLKDSFNFKNSTSKFLLKDILEDYIPASLITNKKRGFAIPISEWLNNELREWSNDYLTKDLFNKHDYFNYDTVENLKKFQNNNHHKIWALIQFNKWYFEVFKK
jgi:asparagine synthase (glutamine-hydrolysing)